MNKKNINNKKFRNKKNKLLVKIICLKFIIKWNIWKALIKKFKNLKIKKRKKYEN